HGAGLILLEAVRDSIELAAENAAARRADVEVIADAPGGFDGGTGAEDEDQETDLACAHESSRTESSVLGGAACRFRSPSIRLTPKATSSTMPQTTSDEGHEQESEDETLGLKGTSHRSSPRRGASSWSRRP